MDERGPIDILFIGDSWQGASDRSLREALLQLPNVSIRDIGIDHYLPRYRCLSLRICNRLLRPLQVAELESAIEREIVAKSPDIVVVYKGSDVRADYLKALKSRHLPVVNIFPDHSPNCYGLGLQKALNAYDLVISTKPYHPRLWWTLYGFHNPCIHVPHGYDPKIHYWDHPASNEIFDVALCATGRTEYYKLMSALARHLGNDSVRVAIAGSNWSRQRAQFPANWHFQEANSGRAYGEFLRSAKIVIAPVNSNVVVMGKRQPGDEDTTRSYELAAMHCFFLHQRTAFINTIYDEQTEVPCWDDAQELAALIRRWLPDTAGRRALSTRAHARAVPAYSIPERAKSILAALREVILSQPPK